MSIKNIKKKRIATLTQDQGTINVIKKTDRETAREAPLLVLALYKEE